MTIVRSGVILQKSPPGALSDAQISEFERAGNVTLAPGLRQRLRAAVRDYHALDLESRTSPRPSAVKDRLDRLRKAADELLDLALSADALGITVRKVLLETQLGSPEKRDRLLDDAGDVGERLKILVSCAVRTLPEDPGGGSPTADAWLIRRAFEIFNEASDGKARRPTHDRATRGYRIVPFVSAFQVLAAVAGFPEARNDTQLAQKIRNALSAKTVG